MSSREVPRLWVIVGATGTGKSQLALDLADVLHQRGLAPEIINADAMQLYRGMDIGTAKLHANQRRGIPHHLIDVLSPRDEATVAWYQGEARALIRDRIESRIPMILVGGSGLYVSSVMYDFQFPPRDHDIRARLERELEDHGALHLVNQLRELAPDLVDQIDTQNPRRIIRALEVSYLGGDPHTVLPRAPQLWLQNTRIVGVHEDRSRLVERLDSRVEEMWASGLVQEVQALIPEGITDGPTASRAIGYAQVLQYLAEDLDRDEAIAQTQQLTRQYARRQVSWFKRYSGVTWVTSDEVIAGTAARNIARSAATQTF